MTPKLKYFLIGLLLLFTCFLLYMVTVRGFYLNEIQSLFNIIGSLSIGIALISYFEKKNKDVTIAAIDLISFFRKEILIANEDCSKFIKKEIPSYSFPSIKLDQPNMASIRKNFPKEAEAQETLRKNHEIFSKQTLVLNMLEELSLKIEHFDILKHPALNSIKIPFVQTVETNAWALLTQREIFAGLPTYQTTLAIYEKWKDEVDRKPPQDRLKETYRQ